MRALVMACALITSSCAAGPQRPPPLSAAQQARCTYESRAATASINSGIMAGFMQADLRDSCAMAAFMQNVEDLGSRLGMRIERGRQPPPTEQARMGGAAEVCGLDPADVARYRNFVVTPSSNADALSEEWKRGQQMMGGAPDGLCATARFIIGESVDRRAREGSRTR